MGLKPLGNLPEHVRRQFAEIGPIWGRDIPRHRDLVLQAYRPLLAVAPKADITVTSNIPYGNDPRQVLDVFRYRDILGSEIRDFLATEC